jgi:hypothetical protein
VGSALARPSIDAEFTVTSVVALHEAALSDVELIELSALIGVIRSRGTVTPGEERRLAVAAPRLLAMLLGMKGRAEELRDRALGQILGGGMLYGNAAGNATLRANVARHILGEKI